MVRPVLLATEDLRAAILDKLASSRISGRTTSELAALTTSKVDRVREQLRKLEGEGLVDRLNDRQRFGRGSAVHFVLKQPAQAR